MLAVGGGASACSGVGCLHAHLQWPAPGSEEGRGLVLALEPRGQCRASSCQLPARPALEPRASSLPVSWIEPASEVPGWGLPPLWAALLGHLLLLCAWQGVLGGHVMSSPGSVHGLRVQRRPSVLPVLSPLYLPLGPVFPGGPEDLGADPHCLCLPGASWGFGATQPCTQSPRAILPPLLGAPQAWGQV